jgi:tRNA pseudouridine65 synthase
MQNIATPLKVLYQDEYLIAVYKPSGLLVHKSMLDKHETQFALQIVRDQLGRYVYPVHRLDKPTSGILLFALDEVIAKEMALLFRKGEVQKTYIAIVRGYTEDHGVIDTPLKQMLDTKEQKQKGMTKEDQEAYTAYERIQTVELPFSVGRYATARYSLIKLTPKTGRKHQLRRHMKHIFHPIIGDTKHGRGEHNQFFRETFGLHRLMLHANTLAFNHPITQEAISIEAPIDSQWSGLYEKFGWMKFEK